MSRLLIALAVIWMINLGWDTSIQAQSAAQYIAKGDKEQRDGYYQSAIEYYRLALRLDTYLLEGNFEVGECYRKLRNYKRALEYYNTTIDLDGEDQMPLAHFYAGLMYKQTGKYREAKRYFNTFLSIYRARDDIYRWARDEVESCEWAIEHQADTAKYIVSRPDSGLNTTHSEMSPFLVDSTTMFFSTMRYESDEVKKKKPIYVEIKEAVLDSGKWKLKDFDFPLIFQDDHVANVVFSGDTQRVYFSKCAELYDCDIYYAKRDGSTWSTPEPLPSPVNEEGSTNTQPTLASFEGEEYLIFASNRERGKGGMDLWFVELKDGMPRTRIRNMGTMINTKGDEITPHYDAVDSILYFSSNRHPGLGGFDLFKSEGMPGRSNPVEHLGTEVNSPADDYYLHLSGRDSVGYFASNRTSGLKKSGNETCCNDFYRIQIPRPPKEIIEEDTVEIDSVEVDTVPQIVEVPTTLEELQTLLPISLYFHNDRPDPRTLARETKLTYPETIEEYVSLRPEYIEAVNQSTLDGTAKMQMGDELVELFEEDLVTSLDRLDKALNVLLIELEDSTNITLAVKGFASPLADSDYNLNLTYRRISSMENYILEYDDGSFKPYLANGLLTIERIPYGESQAAQDISDQLDDKLRAIYSPTAARERRIEILRIERG